MQILNAQQIKPGVIAEEGSVPSTRVHVYGSGMVGLAIYEALAEVLDHDYVVRAEEGIEVGAEDVIVGAIDHSLTHLLEALRATHKGRVLCVHIHMGEAVIGPVIRSGHAGCLKCWRARYYAGKKEARSWANAAVRQAEVRPDPWLTPFATTIIAQIAAHWVAAMIKDNHEGFERWEAYYLDLNTLTGRRALSLPDPLCPACGNRPLDSVEKGQLQLVSRPKPGIDGDRLRDVRKFSDVLFDSYALSPAGIVSEVKQLWRMTNLAVATTYVALTNYKESSYREPCSGFCDRYSIARAVGIIEGLERYTSTRPRDRQFVVHDCLSSLGEVALDPRRFGWYSEQAYHDNTRWLTRFDENLKVDFVWGYSFRRSSPVLVPAQLVYYMEPSGGDPTYVIDSSVGCSMGSVPEEAILHGLLEVLERDAFLLHWYAEHSLAAFDVMECTDPEVRSHNRRLQSENYEVFALDGTTDFGVPAVILFARNRRNAIPYAGCIAAVHPRPERALRKAFRELIPGIRRYGKEVREEKYEHALRLAEDHSRVRTMEDHAYLYCLPQSAHALEFLLKEGKRTSLKQLQNSGVEFCSTDLTDELQRIVSRVLPLAYDIVVVNQTAPELRHAGLHCYKVLVPGSVPMTWGQQMRRLEGIPRLEHALGKTGPANTSRKLNPAPHAFP